MLIVLGAASIVAMVLPRVVVLVIAGAGLAVAMASVIYTLVEFNEAVAQYGVSAVALPNVGPLLAGGRYLATGVLHLIPNPGLQQEELTATTNPGTRHDHRAGS